MASEQQARKLPSEIRLLVALAGLAAKSHPIVPLSPSQLPYFKSQAAAWFESLLKLLEFDRERLPQSVRNEDALESAKEAAADWSEDDKQLIATTLVQAALAAAAGGPAAKEATKADKAREMLQLKSANDEKAQALAYTPLSRSLAHRTLYLLSLPPSCLARAEDKLAISLFEALKTSANPSNKDAQVEEARKSHEAGWGGQLGRALAIGAGTIGAGVLLGVTGGLAAPGIAAVLAPLGISGGLLSASVAPVALGTLFGIGGGGLAGRRVSERWRGVADFGFIEVGKGTKPTPEEVSDMKEVKARAKQDAEQAEQDAKEGRDQQKGDGRLAVEERLMELSIGSPRSSLDHGRSPPTVGGADHDVKTDVNSVKKPPSLTATIVVPGLLTVSGTEAVTAWRALCDDHSTVAPALDITKKSPPLALADGRDVYVLRFETAGMLKTGRDVDFWVTNKLKKKVISEVIKRTVFNAYMAAVALPMSVYSMATMSLDNTWMQAQDKARKAGRILGEVIEKKVQGERPVVLIGSSLGALTVHYALQYLASLPPPTGPENAPVPQYVESAFLISLPSAPSQDEWKKSRQVVARRLVNAWSSNDYVLAGVVRLHEVVSKAAVMSSGLKVAGLGPVEMPGVEDVDVSSALGGHFELQAKMGDIMNILDVDK